MEENEIIKDNGFRQLKIPTIVLSGENIQPEENTQTNEIREE